MNLRTPVVASLVTVGVALWLNPSTVVVAQSCNVSPSRPIGVAVGRASSGVLVAWSEPAGACAATTFYVEASRGTVVQDDRTTATTTITLPLGANNGTPWRISVRGWNAFGLSPQGTVLLDEGSLEPPPPPPPNPCPNGGLPPTLLNAYADGRRVTVHWAHDPRCVPSGALVVGASSPTGPPLGTVTIPYPNTDVWIGEAPPGNYYVRVHSLYEGRTGPGSTSVLVHVP